MKRFLLAALLMALPLAAQQKEVKEERTTKLVHLKYVDPESIRALISQFGVAVMPNSQLKAMTLSGLPGQIAAAEAALQQLDVAPKNIELIAYFVVGSDQTNITGSPVPQEIRDVIGQLKTTFTFKDYRMLDVLTLRTRTGSSAESSGILDARSNPPRLSMFSVRNATVSEDGSTVRLDRMHAGLRIPIVSQGAKTEFMNTGIDQDIDVKEGQKVVVGRASLEGPDKALFVILMARVM
jgi:hypothetical protein